MKKLFLLLAVLVSCGLISCATAKPQQRLSTDSSGIGIVMKIKTIVKLGSLGPSIDKVYFVKVDEGEDPCKCYPLIPSNYNKGDHIYLFNIKPGKYAAVAAAATLSSSAGASAPMGGGGRGGVTYGTSGTQEHITLLPEEMIRKSLIDVKTGKIAFMGKYLIDQSRSMDGADTAQLYYYKYLFPEGSRNMFSAMFLGGNICYKGSLIESSCSKDEQDIFKRNAYNHLLGSGWETTLELK